MRYLSAFLQTILCVTSSLVIILVIATEPWFAASSSLRHLRQRAFLNSSKQVLVKTATWFPSQLCNFIGSLYSITCQVLRCLRQQCSLNFQHWNNTKYKSSYK
jgi:hypothetical protein